MRVEHLVYLLEVAKCNSISAAARNLLIGQTSLSAIIKSIEDELGVKIFVRTPKGVKLTSHGEPVMGLAENIVNSHEKMLNLFNIESAIKKHVNVVCYPGACLELSPVLTKRIMSVYHDVVLNVHEAPTSRIVRSLVNGVAGIGVGSSGNYGIFSSQMEARNNHFQFEPLYTDHFCLCVRSDSPFAGRRHVEITELANQTMAMAFYFPQFINTSIGNTFRQLGQYHVYSNTECIKRCVASCSSAAILPSLSLKDDIYITSGLLTTVPLCGFPTDLINYMVYVNPKELNPAEHLVIEEIRHYYRHLEKSSTPDGPALPDSGN